MLLKKWENKWKNEKIKEKMKNRNARNKENISLVKYNINEICHIYTRYCIIYIDGALF